MKYSPYKALTLTTGIHFFIMYALTYAAIHTFADGYLNINRFYMAVIMVAPMVILMISFMPSMYSNKPLNAFLLGGSALVFVLGFSGIRTQTFVDDMQFLRSMIPHHSSAIVMCENSDIQDPEILELCDGIVQTQQEEIDQMNVIMQRLDQ